MIPLIYYSDQFEFFGAFDILLIIFWLAITLIFSFVFQSNNIANKPHYKYFIRNYLFKLGFSLLFSLYYIFIVHGGDTIAFYDTSEVLTNLLIEDFSFYIEEWGTYTSAEGYVNHFTANTGFPPGWIAREEEAYFVSKIFSIVNLFTGSSYLVNTIIVAFLTSAASFKLYDFIVSFGIHDYKKLALYFLFIPSLSFWCTGVSKDSLIFISICYLVPTIYNLINGVAKIKVVNIILIVFFSWMLLNIRSFMLITIIIPFAFAFNVQFAKRLFENKFIQFTIRTLIIFIGFGFLGFYFSGETAQKYLKEAEITQQDFKTNKTYTGAKYDIGVVSYTPTGLLRVMPLSVITGIYRPFPWEALSLAFILNGIETLILFYLTFIFIFRGGRKRIGRIRNTDILTFSLYFVIIFAFMTGFTSVIFGVLVRLRAPLLPFFMMLLTVNPEEEKIELEETHEEIA